MFQISRVRFFWLLQNGGYLDSLGWVYFRLGNYDLAEENLRRASEKIGTDPTVQAHLGDLYQKTGRLKQATTLWQRAGRVEQDRSRRSRRRRDSQGAKGPRIGEGQAGEAEPRQRIARYQKAGGPLKAPVLQQAVFVA